jgi:uracil-DNA glycosylase family 4
VTFIANCPDCPYRQYGRAVGARGNPSSRIVLVGEAPGEKEIVSGEPFRGPAGDVLWRAAAEAGLLERDLFITNSVACRPYDPIRPKVRKPSRDAVLACHSRLVQDVTAHPRSAIVAVGVTAVQALTGQRRYPIASAEPGAALQSEFGTVVPALHPAFVLRRGMEGSQYRRLVQSLVHVEHSAR